MGSIKKPGAEEVVTIVQGAGKTLVEKKAQIRINDFVYDVTDFVKLHPGGRIIEMYYGQDATEAYGAFHSGSKTSAEMLMALPKTPVKDVLTTQEDGSCPSLTEPPSALTVEFRKLRAKWKNEGMFKGRLLMELGLFFAILLLVAFSMLLLHFGWLVTSGLIMGCAWAQCGFLQHNLGHLEVFHRPAWDRAGNLFVEGFLKGGSGSWWRNRHSKHHAKTNINPHDTDLRTTPLFAWDDHLALKCPKWLARYQHILFIPLLGLYVPIFFFTTKRYMLVKRKYEEMVLSALHYVAFVSLILAVRPDTTFLGIVMWFYVGYAIQGIYLGFFFSLSHFALPVSHDKEEDVDWVTMHCRSTLDWGQDWFGWAWIAGHLNYQIEHHLVPEMPSYNYKIIHGDVEALCKAHGVQYINMTFWESVELNLGTLKSVGQRRADGESQKGTSKEPLLQVQ